MGKSNVTKGMTVAACLIILGAGAIVGLKDVPAGEEQSRMGFSPLNPAFVEFMEGRDRDSRWPLYSMEGHPLGLVPAPQDLSWMRDLGTPRIDGLPKSYDLRNNKKVTPIRNQGLLATCWAFAAFGALESRLLPGKAWDFSEWHMVENNGFDLGERGNIQIALGYLAGWNGPVNEKDCPYNTLPVSGGMTVRKHLDSAIFIPPRKNAKDNNRIKKAVMQYGAVYTTMYIPSQHFNTVYNTFYNPGLMDNPHAVAVVGWDNTFDRNRFNIVPPGNGAFIVRNSWGKNWGENGYFYVSYHDAYFARRDSSQLSAAFKRVAPKNNYKVVYQYDPLGYVRAWGFDSEIGWFANIFKAKSNLPIQAVSFYALGAPTNYEIYIYTDVSAKQPRGGILATTQKGKLAQPGYYTIKLKKKVPLLKNAFFSVVVKVKAKGNKKPIPVENIIMGYSSQAAADFGQSFYSGNGKNWMDAHAVYNSTNVCVKAFAK